MSNSAEKMSKRVVLGQIGKVHGIKGWLRLNSFTTPPENILEYSELFAEIDESWQVLEISQFKQQSKGLIVHFTGYDDPDIAKQLTGLEVVIASEDLPGLEDGSFYWHELEGMEVSNQQGQVFGLVARLLETGANDVLVVKASAGSIDEKERLIPYIKESVIKNIDTATGKIVVDWEADYLE
jgi:16S rRNA processing protein RimM